ncbi:MAG TPA: DUF4136 domain-containing protein [Allosphingosinicella sp.]|nr:DUF4136 domain-containing protein [Allosphingosinicella sp.]
MSLKHKFLTLAAPALIAALSACTTGFPTQVSRFQAMPAPAGQTFVIEPAQAEDRGGLEFAQYADLVRRHLTALGYAEASSPREASFIVTMDYGVDQGRERVIATRDPFMDPWGYHPWGYGGFGRRPFFSRYGYYRGFHNPFYWGWHDPFWGGYDVSSYTLYTSFLDLDIHRAGDRQALFEGHAEARSRTNELPALVPNLIEAMFTGFPGNSGERVRITVMPPEQRR